MRSCGKFRLHVWEFVARIAYMAITGKNRQDANRPFYSCVLGDLALIGSEAGGDLVLIQTSPLFICEWKLVGIRTAWSTYEKQWGLYQNKVIPSLACNPEPGHLAHNCKMAYCEEEYSTKLCWPKRTWKSIFSRTDKSMVVFYSGLLTGHVSSGMDQEHGLWYAKRSPTRWDIWDILSSLVERISDTGVILHTAVDRVVFNWVSRKTKCKVISLAKPQWSLTTTTNVNNTYNGLIRSGVKRRELPVSKSWLGLVLLLIGWKNGSSFVNHSQSVEILLSKTKENVIIFNTSLKTALTH